MLRRDLATLLLSCVVLVSTACSGNGASKGSPLAPGFYRASNGAAVYHLTQNTYCVVVNPAQMQRFGGFSKVHVVDPSVDITAGRAPESGKTGPCPWPDGIYRERGARASYRISGATACRFVKGRSTSVYEVPAHVDVLLNKRFTGNCPPTR